MYTKYRLAYTEAPLTACCFQPGCRLHPPSVLGVGIAAVGMAAVTARLGFLITCASFSAASRSASASAAASAAASSLYEPRAADPSAVSPSCATSGASVRAGQPDGCRCKGFLPPLWVSPSGDLESGRLAGLHAHANHRCQLGGRKSTPLLPARGVDGREAPHRSSGVRTTDRRGCPRPFGLDSGDPQGTTVDARPSMCVYQA